MSLLTLTGRSARSSIVWAALLALVALPLAAGSLDVNGGAASEGSFGLEVTLGGPCAFPNEVVLEPPANATLSGSFDACVELEALSTTVTGNTDLTAGRAILLGEGFRVDLGVEFSAAINAAQDPFAFVGDATPTALDTYSALFSVNLDGLTLDPADEIEHLTGLAADGTVLFRVILLRNAALSENRLVLEARLNGGGIDATPMGEQLLIPGGFRTIEISWVADGGGGHLLAAVDMAPLTGLTGLINDELTLESVLWGANSGDVAASTGSLLLDDFSSFR